MTSRRGRQRDSLEFLDCDAVEHAKAVTAADFAFNGDRLSGVVGELIVQRVVAPDEQINPAIILTLERRSAPVGSVLFFGNGHDVGRLGNGEAVVFGIGADGVLDG